MLTVTTGDVREVRGRQDTSAARLTITIRWGDPRDKWCYSCDQVSTEGDTLPWSVVHDPQYGRYLVASRDILPGTGEKDQLSVISFMIHMKVS